MSKPINISESLKELEAIVAWFEQRQDVDVELALQKTKEAAELIKALRARLRTVANEFEEIKQSLGDE